MHEAIIVYISIGNSDDKLAQFQWHAFVQDVKAAVANLALDTFGVWFSPSEAAHQNACWCVGVRPVMVDDLRDRLAQIAKAYRQESIAWAVAQTEFIRPAA